MRKKYNCSKTEMQLNVHGRISLPCMIIISRDINVSVISKHLKKVIKERLCEVLSNVKVCGNILQILLNCSLYRLFLNTTRNDSVKMALVVTYMYFA